MWPDYLTRERLAKRLDLEPGAIDQLVQRGCLPPPTKIGEAKRWRWADVDSFIRSGHITEAADDPYAAGAIHAAQAPATRSPSKVKGQAVLLSSDRARD